MEDLIAKTKAKVVAEKQAQAAPDYTEAKVKSRVELITMQIEQASTTNDRRSRSTDTMKLTSWR